MKPFRIGIVTAIWQRHELAAEVLGYYSALSVHRVKLVPVAVGSEGELSRRVAEDAGWDYVEHPNEPLGAKWNAGLRALEGRDVDAVVVVGSDDFLSPVYFKWVVGHIQAGSDAFILRGCHFYNLDDDRTAFAPRFTSGAGRFMSRSLLDRMGWAAWPDDQARFLDGAADEACRKAGGRVRIMHTEEHGMALLDVKSDTNMWSWDSIRDRTRTWHPVGDAWWEKHFPGVRARLQSIANTTAYHG